MTTRNTAIRHPLAARGVALTAILAACMVAAATRAQAAEPTATSGPVMKTVVYTDLNLANPEGIERLYRRIAAAAQEVCDSRQGRSLEAQALDTICTRQAIARAVAAVGQPALTSLHARKSGESGGTTTLAKQ